MVGRAVVHCFTPHFSDGQRGYGQVCLLQPSALNYFGPRAREREIEIEWRVGEKGERKMVHGEREGGREGGRERERGGGEE